jgi:hypothetical protein
MVGPVPGCDQVMAMGRSPNVICTWVTLLKGMATIAIIAEDVFLNTAQIRNGTHEPLFPLKEHPLNTADLRTTTFDTCGPSAAKGTAGSKSFVEGIGFPMEHTTYIRPPKMPDSHVTD